MFPEIHKCQQFQQLRTGQLRTGRWDAWHVHANRVHVPTPSLKTCEEHLQKSHGGAVIS